MRVAARVRDYRHTATIAALTAGAIVMALAVLGVRDIRGLLQDERIVAHTNQVIESLGGLLVTMDDAETGQRGYIITGRDDFLDPYRDADKAASKSLSELKILVSDNPVQTATLDTLAGLVAKKFDLMSETINLRKASGLAPAAALVSAGLGKAVMDSVRTAVKAMKQRERDLLKVRSDRQGRDLKTAELVGTLGIAGAALLVLFAGSLIRRTAAMHRRGRHTASYIRTLLDATSDGIYGLDKAGKITFVNRATAKILGYAPDEMIGQAAHQLFHHTRPDGTPYPETECPMYHVAIIEIGGNVDNEIIWRRDGSSLPVEYSINAVTDQDGNRGAVVSFRDITDRQLAEQALREGRDASERANVAKNEFLARMSHELRTPLNSVIGFANVLLRNKAGNLRSEDVDYLDRIQKNGVRLLELIDDILDLSKIEAGRMDVDAEPVDVGELARDVAAEFDTQIAARNLALSVDAPSGLVPLTTDRLKLRQVLLNLVGNAIKFTERGSVRISVICVGGGRVPSRIEVADSGIGIPADRISAIFDPFEQAEKSTTRKYGGTGLGLPISRSLCELLGFNLIAHSTSGKGSTFIVDLAPETSRREQHAAVAPTAAAGMTGSEAALRGRKVLVIDDDPDARHLVERLVRDLGGRAIEASSGPEGLRLARTAAPDIIALDLAMPGMTGWEVMKELAADEALKKIPVVIVSGHVRDRNVDLLGAVTVVPKPIDENALASALLHEIGTGKVLIVDDDPDTLKLLTEYVYEEGAAEVRVAAGGAEALEAVDKFFPDLILLDILMPDVDGFAVLAALDDHPRRDEFSVVIVSSKELSSKEALGVRVPIFGVLRKGRNLESELRSMVRGYLSAAHSTKNSDPEA